MLGVFFNLRSVNVIGKEWDLIPFSMFIYDFGFVFPPGYHSARMVYTEKTNDNKIREKRRYRTQLGIRTR